MEMLSKLSEVLAAITIARASGGIPQKIYKQMLSLELEGEAIYDALASFEDKIVLSRYCHFVESALKESAIKAKSSKDRDVREQSLDRYEAISSTKTWMEVRRKLEITPANVVTADEITSVKPEEKSFPAVFGGEVGFSYPDEYGFTGYRRVDSEIGIIFDHINSLLMRKLLASCKF